MAQTNQTIGNFLSRAQQREFSRDILFRVLNITFAGGATFDENDLIYVRAAKLPPRDIVNVPTPYMGLDFNIPGVTKYPGSDAYELEFYCDAQSILHNKFLTETRRVFDDATSTGDYNISGANSTITLVQLDKNLEPVNTYKLIGASVRSTGEIQYTIAEGTGQFVTFTSVVAYHFFTESIVTA